MDFQQSSPSSPSHFQRSPTMENFDRAIMPRAGSAASLDRAHVIQTWAISDVPLRSDTMVPPARSETLSRAVNIVLAALGLLLAAPLFLLVAIAVKLSSPGPIFYRQARVGIDRRRRGRDTDMLFDRRAKDLGGSVFTIYKFRSMRANAENRTGAVWATKGDPRVTTVGRVIRKTRLDELPQLLNVIKGDMNIVGPRPERPSIFLRLSETIEDYPMRQLAKPGITGWAQVNRSYDACLDDVRQKVRYDLEYIQRQSIVEDLKIMLKTVPVIILGEKGW
jgi:lipopolysaccharide/colanic/teichoic acid biosynthesis glycosyltransferase